MAGLESLVGGWFASPVIRRVVEKAKKFTEEKTWRHLEANLELQKSAQQMVEDLTDTLVRCQATVTEVEKRAIINNPALADCLRRLKQAGYDAEDVLDNMEAQSIKDEVQGKNKVSRLASFVRNIINPDDNLKSLREVVDKLKQISTHIPEILKLVSMNKKNESHNREVSAPKETSSQPLEDVDLYGRQKELNMIFDIILRSEPEHSESESSKKGGQNYNNYHGIFVIPIVGMGGVGKTALAQAVYNNPEVQETFAKRAWISVSNKSDVKRVMGEIYESFSPNSNLVTLAYESKESISKLLSGVIEGAKFLIVLDDMFESEWDFIHKIFSRGAPGSVVLITTQNQEFANRVVGNTLGAIGPIALSALDSGVFWELFEHFAFRNVASEAQSRNALIPIGKIIANKLHGLPLAAKIIGKVLNSKLDEHSWTHISKSEWWEITKAKSQILPSVGIGYEQLDTCLRQCFAYCSLFPRNSLIEKDRLVHMWIAQNFIQSDVHGVRLEDIGRQWFDELVKRSFFQRAWDNNSYVMHELMHDLAVIVSSGECFYLGEGVEVDKIPFGVRHLAVDTKDVTVISKIQKHKNLRSFLYFVRCEVRGMYTAIQDMLCHLNSIRVLDLSYMHMENNNKPPNAIWDLHHLRFLDLSFTGIRSLYHSSIYLYHLQALYIRECKLEKLPLGINKLINLRHLYAEEETIAQISGIGQLTNLQELGVFIVREKRGYTITELENLKEIGGTLIIKNFENIKNKDEAMKAKLVDKEHLYSIHIIGSHANRNSNEDKEVLQELQPNKDIKDLTIQWYAGLDFPHYWIIQIGDHFPNLSTLCLVSCVNVEVLPPLGELPSLKSLQIEKFDSVKQIDSHLYGKNKTVFPLLEVLVLDTLSNCEEWTDAGAREFFPRLSQLTIESNYTLREAPLNLFRSTLKKLKIRGCRNLISLGNLISNPSYITHLELHSSLESITLDPLNMPLLEDLALSECPELKIKGDLTSLTHLKRLILFGCPKLFSTYSTEDQQKGEGLQVHQDVGLRSLTHMEADNSLLNHEYHLILGSLPSLRILKFSSKITHFTKNQNLWFEEMTALKEITFSSCEFVYLPACLTQLSTVKKMALERCTRLQSLTNMMPPNLQELHLTSFSWNLVQMCKAYEGRGRQFISRILVIHIDDYTDRNDAVPKYATKMESMEIRKPQISDAIGRQQACASCGKIFEFRDLVLRNWK